MSQCFPRNPGTFLSFLLGTFSSLLSFLSFSFSFSFSFCYSGTNCAKYSERFPRSNNRRLIRVSLPILQLSSTVYYHHYYPSANTESAIGKTASFSRANSPPSHSTLLSRERSLRNETVPDRATRENGKQRRYIHGSLFCSRMVHRGCWDRRGRRGHK